MALRAATLESIRSISDRKKKIKKLNELIVPYLGTKSKAEPDVSSIKTFIDFVVNTIGESDTTTSKPVLLRLTESLEEVDADYNDQLTEISKFFVERLRPKYSYFSDSLLGISRLLAELYQADEDYSNAGRVMASIDTEDQHYWSPAFDIVARCEWRIVTAELFLQNEDNTAATKHIQKCRKLMRDIPLKAAKVKQQLGLRYKTCYSRILDSERKFLAAAVNYLEIAQIDTNLFEEGELNPADLITSLENAVVCAILAKAGGPRIRVLAMLHRDERSQGLKNYKVLEKMHRNMILSKKDQDDFAKGLLPHHQATLAGGLTVLQKAVYEHNMLAAAQLYKNIRIEELSKLLGVTLVQAEDLARVMIQENRLSATIDQVDGVIEFDADDTILSSWDSAIAESLMVVNDIIDLIENKSSLEFSI